MSEATQGFAHDPRWGIFVNKRLGDARLATLDDLVQFTKVCIEIISSAQPDGASELLKVARSLFIHSWLDADFLSICAVVCLQALEAQVRQIYPGEEKVPFMALVNRIEDAGILPPVLVAVVKGGVDLRNQMAHPLTVATWEPANTALLLETSHRLLAIMWRHAK
jgi:hypothetical protein